MLFFQFCRCFQGRNRENPHRKQCTDGKQTQGWAVRWWRMLLWLLTASKWHNHANLALFRTSHCQHLQSILTYIKRFLFFSSTWCLIHRHFIYPFTALEKFSHTKCSTLYFHHLTWLWKVDIGCKIQILVDSIIVTFGLKLS